MKKQISPRLGIDIGRVIIGPVVDGVADTSFLGNTLEKAMLTTPSPRAFESIACLVALFEGNAWLVSKCGPGVQQKTKAWLRHWRFHEHTGVPESHVRFCRERAHKAHHCKQLKITHFIDDRMDVLTHLRGLVPHLYLFGEQPKLRSIPDWLVHTKDWPAVTDQIKKAGDLGGRL
ncbi:MAG: hypothetical protein MI864_08985 [Pseudomonadales bacterium]|nr:hypothetical protein [Pseudomonadales bacterium]